MKNLASILAISISIIMVACGPSKQKSNEAKESTDETSVIKSATKLVGFQSIEELAKSVINSLVEKDYDEYFTHVMSEKMELSQAEKLKNQEVKDEFLKEFGFSLHEEKDYFDNTVKYFDEQKIDLKKAKLDEIEYTEYKGGEYEPLMLYEVFVPIEAEYEMLVDFTIIEVDGSYFLTSELGI